MADRKNPDLGAQIPKFGAAKTPAKPVKQRDMSHDSAPLLPGLAKTQNPDLGVPVSQIAPLPSSPPVAALQPYGVHLGVQDVNSRVQAVTDAHMKAFGTPPSPDLMFDILKTPFDQEPDWNQMFGATSKRQIAAKNALANYTPGPQHPDMTYIRRDGLVVHPSPPGLPRSDTLTSLHKQYPMVVVGEVPIPGADTFYKALRTLSADPEAQDKLKAVGTIAQENTGANASPVPMSTRAGGMTIEQAEQIQKMRSLGTGTGAAGAVNAELRSAVTTIKQAQEQLNQMMGTKLPATGFWTSDWAKNFENWTKTRSYFQETAQFKAKQLNMSYSRYLKSFETKSKLVQKHGGFGDFLNALPIQAFDHGSSPWDITKALLEHPFANPSFSVSYPLHALTRTGGEGLDVMGGAITQGKQDAAAGMAFMNVVTDQNKDGILGKKGHQTLEEAKAKMHKSLSDPRNATWMHVFDPNIDPNDEKGLLKTVDGLTNLAADLILLRKPVLTGGRLEAGDVARAAQHGYIKSVAPFAYAHLARDEPNLAARLLEGGEGSEQLVRATRQSIKKGWMTPDVFQNHLAELYSTGHTTVTVLNPKIEGRIETLEKRLSNLDATTPEVGSEEEAKISTEKAEINTKLEGLRKQKAEPVEVRVSGGTLASLRTKDLITPSKTRLTIKDWTRSRIDNFSKGAEMGGRRGNLAEDFAQFMRSEFQHVAPKGYRGSFDPRTPERLHDFVVRHFQNPKLANELESQFILARAGGNLGKIEKIEQRVHRLYYGKYTGGPGKMIEDDPFQPMLEAEAGSRMFFPTGNFVKPTNPMEAAVTSARKGNAALNTLGGKLRRIIILSPMLAVKHAVGDPIRRFVGGGFDYSAGTRAGQAEIDALLKLNPELSRRYGTALDRTTTGEAYYMANPGERTESFNTREHFGQQSYMTAAGQNLRVLLDDRALAAYRASSPDDMSALIRMVENNRSYRRLFAGKQKESALKKYGSQAMKNRQQLVSEGHGLRVQNYREMLDSSFSMQDYAAQIFNRYKRFEEAAQAKDKTINDALDVLRANRGAHAEEALGKWISDNKIDFHVDKGLVHDSFSYDNITSKMVQLIMTANKKNRAGMFKTLTANQFNKLREAGWDAPTALHVAMDVAEKQTVYHMLDFANQLQFEQDFRWLSYFMTKHRLYWKWVLSTAVHQPFTAQVIRDIKPHLDDNGNFNFHALGNEWQIPAARLVWVNSKEYPEESPLAGGLAEFLKNGFSFTALANGTVGSLGTGIQRNAAPAAMLTKYAEIETGLGPATYKNAIHNMNQTDRRSFDRLVNHFSMDYYGEHGYWPPQSMSVKYGLLHLSMEDLARANLPLNIITGNKAKNEQEKMLDTFMSMVDPVKRSKYLDAHPQLQALFGLSKTPADYQHYRTYWSQYTQALDQYHHARDEIYNQVVKTGSMTPELEAQRRKISSHFEDAFNKLKAQDLAATPKNRQKEINGELLGLWGQQQAANPLANPAQALKKLFPNLTKTALSEGLPSKYVTWAKQELDRLKDPNWVKDVFPDTTVNGAEVDSAAARSYQAQLLDFIQEFQPQAHDKLGKLEEKYIAQHVNPYWNNVDVMTKRIDKLGKGQKGLAYAQLRDWKDQQMQPVKVDGVEFPPPGLAAWQNLPPALYNQRIAQLATGAYSNLADYEKKLLGLKPPEYASHGWEALDQWRAEASAHGLTITSDEQRAAVVQIDKQLPGFLKDWKESQLPRIDLFEKMNVYKTMPKDVRTFWDSTISPYAHKFAEQYNKQGISNKREIKLAWEKAVNMTPTAAFPQVGPIAELVLSNPDVMKWMQPYLNASPDFLNTLINKSNSTNA